APRDLGAAGARTYLLPARRPRLRELALAFADRRARVRPGARSPRGGVSAHAQGRPRASHPGSTDRRTRRDGPRPGAARSRSRPAGVQPFEPVRHLARVLAGGGVLVVTADVVAQPAGRADAGAR